MAARIHCEVPLDRTASREAAAEAKEDLMKRPRLFGKGVELSSLALKGLHRRPVLSLSMLCARGRREVGVGLTTPPNVPSTMNDIVSFFYQPAIALRHVLKDFLLLGIELNQLPDERVMQRPRLLR